MKQTYPTLHKLSRALVQIRKQMIDPLPHSGESALFYQNDLITTGLLNNTTELALNLLISKFMIHHKDKVSFISISKPDFPERALDILQKFALPIPDKTFPNVSQDEIDQFLPFAHKAQRSLAFFRSNLGGDITPVYLWGHAFDFSVEWHAPRRGGHIITGIAPYDELDPDAYAYLVPQPFDHEFTKTSLPLGSWNTQGWNGIKIPWTTLEALSMKEIAAHLTSFYALLYKQLYKRAHQFDPVVRSIH